MKVLWGGACAGGSGAPGVVPHFPASPHVPHSQWWPLKWQSRCQAPGGDSDAGSGPSLGGNGQQMALRCGQMDGCPAVHLGGAVINMGGEMIQKTPASCSVLPPGGRSNCTFQPPALGLSPHSLPGSRGCPRSLPGLSGAQAGTRPGPPSAQRQGRLSPLQACSSAVWLQPGLGRAQGSEGWRQGGGGMEGWRDGEGGGKAQAPPPPPWQLGPAPAPVIPALSVQWGGALGPTASPGSVPRFPLPGLWLAPLGQRAPVPSTAGQHHERGAPAGLLLPTLVPQSPCQVQLL